MRIPALPSVEAAILHDHYKPLDGQIIFDAIQHLSAALGYATEVQLMVTSTQTDIHVHVDGHRALVSQNNEPLDIDGFRSTLSTPYTGFILPNANDVVATHRANTFITIGKGIIDPNLAPELLGDLLGDDAAFSTLEEAQRAMVFCHQLVHLIIRNNPATAIHWCPSDNLISQSFFEEHSSPDNLTLLGIRPYLTSSAGRLADGEPLGMVVNGSQWLIGKIIQFKEAPVPFPWMLDVVMSFIAVCQIRGSIFPDGDTFSVEGQDWTISVSHEKIEGFDAWEAVNLVVVDAPEFGIHGETTAKRTFRYDSEDDIRAQASVESSQARAANENPPQPRRTPPRRNLASRQNAPRQNTRQLRELAVRSNSANAEANSGAEAELPKKGILAKAAGLFSKN